MSRFYISGAIAGHPDGNREAFERAAERLEELGHEAVNPHDIDPDHDGPCRIGYADAGEHTSACHLRADIRKLLDCDSMALLPGWGRSRGANIEVTVANAIGIPVYKLPEVSA